MDTFTYLKEKYKAATITTAQAAEELNCHPSHVRAMCQNGQLPAVRLGDRWHLPIGKFAALLEGEDHD